MAAGHVLLRHMTQLWSRSSGFSTPALLRFPSSVHARLSCLTLVPFPHRSEKSGSTERNETPKRIKLNALTSCKWCLTSSSGTFHVPSINIKQSTSNWHENILVQCCSQSLLFVGFYFFFFFFKSSCLPPPVWSDHSSRFKLLILPGASVCRAFLLRPLRQLHTAAEK